MQDVKPEMANAGLPGISFCFIKFSIKPPKKRDKKSYFYQKHKLLAEYQLMFDGKTWWKLTAFFLFYDILHKIQLATCSKPHVYSTAQLFLIH